MAGPKVKADPVAMNYLRKFGVVLNTSETFETMARMTKKDRFALFTMTGAYLEKVKAQNKGGAI